MDLKKIVLSDSLNRWVFRQGKKDIYLVGGYVRDLLRGEVSRDRDFVLDNNVEEVARNVANKFKGTFVELKKNQTYRVVLKKNREFIDFTQMRKSITEDLSRRDFTINAIAWSPGKGIIDPFNGASDLKNKIMKVVSPMNLKEDPLRILRAYRIGAQLGLDIREDTVEYLIKYSGRLKDAAPERITEELCKFVMADNALYYISLSIEHNVMSDILSITKNNLMKNMVLNNAFDKFLNNLSRSREKKQLKNKVVSILDHHVGQGLNGLGFIRLSLLMKDFYGTESFRNDNLRFSNRLKNRMIRIQKGLKLSEGRVTDSRLYEIFNAAENCEMEMALILTAKRLRNVNKYMERAERLMEIKTDRMIDGNEIKNLLNREPGPLTGSIISELEKRRFLGFIQNKAEARKWIISNFT